MKITHYKIDRFSAPLKRPFVTSLREVSQLKDLVIEVVDEDGVCGLGEGAATPPITGETLGSIESGLEYLMPFILNKHFASIDALMDEANKRLRGNTTLKAMLNSALYDIASKKSGLPLYKYLNAHSDTTTLSSDITISLGSPEQMQNAALEAISKGYETLKLKIGADAQSDAKSVVALCKNLPSNVRLLLDANQAYSTKETIALLHYIEAHGIRPLCIEQPIGAENLEGFKEIKKRCTTPLMADESAFNAAQLKVLFEMEAVDLVNIKLAKCGGIDEAFKMIALCEKYGKNAMMGCMMEGIVAIATAANVAATFEQTVILHDLDTPFLLRGYRYTGEMRFDEPHIELAHRSGIGIETI